MKLPGNKQLNLFIDEEWVSWQFVFNYKWHDVSESKVLRILNDYYPLKAAFIDVGANLGLMTLYSVAINRRGVLFEPNKKLNDFTKRQYACNNYTNYVIENYCLSDKPGKATFYISGSSFQSSLNKGFAESDKYGGLTGEITVDLITLDQYLQANPDIEPGIIKVDAEGHDLEVLLGAQATIAKYSPAIVVEVNSPERAEIISLMEGHGYNYFGITKKSDDMLILPANKERFVKCQDIVFVKDEKLTKVLSSYAV